MEESMLLLKRQLRADDRKTRKQRRKEREAKEAVSGVCSSVFIRRSMNCALPM